MNFEVFDENFLKFQHPFTCLIVGPTKCGKTQFVYKFLQAVEKMVEPPPDIIYFVYSEWQPAYQQMMINIPKLQMIEGMIDINELKKDINQPKLLIFDDLMSELAKDKTLNTIFTRGAHHWSTSVK